MHDILLWTETIRRYRTLGKNGNKNATAASEALSKQSNWHYVRVTSIRCRIHSQLQSRIVIHSCSDKPFILQHKLTIIYTVRCNSSSYFESDTRAISKRNEQTESTEHSRRLFSKIIRTKKENGVLVIFKSYFSRNEGDFHTEDRCQLLK